MPTISLKVTRPPSSPADRSARELGKPLFRAGLDLREVLRRHDAFLHQRLAREQLNLEPEAELVFVRPDGPHFRAGIPLNHAGRITNSARGVEDENEDE